ncbi:hypothetical protein EC2731150_1839 [Escherichia coli 2731150]|nr:hypothetical protein EC2762100_1388 [Escherichia coli 2762100]EMW82573.1 hypothetical protein EC2731150_1839 [Escherichia coli 2731150]
MYFIRRRISIHFEFILEISTSHSRFNNYFELSHFTTALSGGLLLF